MPYETVQYPRTDVGMSTEVSVHWSKNGHVQLQVQRHEFIHHPDPDWPTDLPPQPVPFPPGTLRLAPDGRLAYRVETDSTGYWAVSAREGEVRSHGGSVIAYLPTTVAAASQPFYWRYAEPNEVDEWPVIHYGDGRPISATVYTDVMDRDQLNRLIRVLRQARDAAYGADA